MGSLAGQNIFGADRFRGLIPPVSMPPPVPAPPPVPTPYTPPSAPPPSSLGPIEEIVAGSRIGSQPIPSTAPIVSSITNPPRTPIASPGRGIPTPGRGTEPVVPPFNPIETPYPAPTPPSVPTRVGGPIRSSGIVTTIAGGADSDKDGSVPTGVPTWMQGSSTYKPAVGSGGVKVVPPSERPDELPTPKLDPSKIVSDIVATPPVAPTPAPIAPAPVAPAPSPKRTKAPAETDPYERWKQLGRPGGSFEDWKATQGG